MSNLIPSQTRDALAWWREHEHFLIWGTLIISGVAAVGLAVAFVHAVRIGAPLAAKVVAAKYLPAAAVAVI